MNYCIQNKETGKFVDYDKKLGDIWEIDDVVKVGMLYRNKSDADDDVEILNQMDKSAPYKVVRVLEASELCRHIKIV